MFEWSLKLIERTQTILRVANAVAPYESNEFIFEIEQTKSKRISLAYNHIQIPLYKLEILVLLFSSVCKCRYLCQEHDLMKVTNRNSSAMSDEIMTRIHFSSFVFMIVCVE